jgi:hypothetical protein
MTAAPISIRASFAPHSTPTRNPRRCARRDGFAANTRQIVSFS